MIEIFDKTADRLATPINLNRTPALFVRADLPMQCN